MSKLIIQIPCYNEAGTLAVTLTELPRSVPGFDCVEWLIVDDGSEDDTVETRQDRKSTRLNSSHPSISYAVFCLKKKRDPLPQNNSILISFLVTKCFSTYACSLKMIYADS